jgi:hypothetical protein
VDATYPQTGGTAPNWTFASTPSSTRAMVEGVTQDGSTPVFEYFAYGVARNSSGSAYLDTAGNPYVMLLDGTSSLPSGVTTSSGGSVAPGTIPANSPSPLPTSGTGLSAANAEIASAVRVTMLVRPSGKMGSTTQDYDEATSFSNTFSLRMTPPLSDRNPQLVVPCA